MDTLNPEFLKFVIGKNTLSSWKELFEEDKTGIKCIITFINYMENAEEITTNIDEYNKLKDFLYSTVRIIQMAKITGVSLIISFCISIIVFYESYDINLITSLLSSVIHRFKLFDEKIICIKKNIIEEIQYDVEDYLNYTADCNLLEFSDRELIVNTKDTILPIFKDLV